MTDEIFKRRNFPASLPARLALIALLLAAPAIGGFAQTVKGRLDFDTPPPPLTWNGIIPGRSTYAQVKAAVGEPEYEASWYSWKMYYPAAGRPGMPDVVQLHGHTDNSIVGSIEAATIPAGFEDADAIRRQLGEPEYELRMATWRLLDYSVKGVRFSLDAKGKTTGVAYFLHGNRRVHDGERRFMDLSDARQGPQPEPENPAPLGGLRVGTAEIVFTPLEQSWLPGTFTVHDDLKARIAVFERDGLSVALVGADLFGAGWEEMKVIRDNAAKGGVDHTLIGMSHNHATGDTIGVYGHYPSEYIAHFQERITEGIAQAAANLRPVKEFRAASRELPMDGARVIGLFRNARNPGVLDPTISLMQAIGEDGRPITTIVNFACHVESLGYKPLEISADFPGYMCERMKEDGMGQPVFLNGALGGMVSGDNRARTHESSREMGLELAGIVRDLAKTAVRPAEFDFGCDVARVEIPMMNPRFKPLYARGIRKLHRGRVVTDMMCVRLGEARIVSLPGELLPEVSYEILEKTDGFPKILVGLANDQLGYMIPPYDFRDDYYEESVSQGPAAALIVRDTAIRLLSDKEGAN